MPRLNYNLDEIADYTPVPKGRFRAKLTKCTQAKSKSSGQPMLVWDWKILTGKGKGHTARTWTSLQPQALSALKNHLTAFGMSGKVKNKSTDQLIGKIVVLVVVDTESVREGHEGEPDSKILMVLPKDAPLTVEEPEEEDEDEDDENDEDEEDDEDEDEDEDDDDDWEDEDEEEDEEEDEPPVKKPKKRRKA